MGPARAGSLPLRAAGRRAGGAPRRPGGAGRRARGRARGRLRELEQAILAQDPALDLDDRAVRCGPAHADGRRSPGVPTRGWPATRSTTRRCSAAATGWSAPSSPPWSTTGCSWCPGSSGAGKSSVVRAGLVPGAARRARCREATRGSRSWSIPGPRPVDTLSPLTGEDPPRRPVVLVCDQLEQLWSAGTPAGERTAFLDTVLGLLADDVVTRCVLVVRGDHVGRLAEHPDLAQQLHGALVMVPPLTETELRQVVEEPARAAGLDGRARPDRRRGARRPGPLGRAAAAVDGAGGDLGAAARRHADPGGLPGHRRGHRRGGALRRDRVRLAVRARGSCWRAGSWCGSPSRTSRGPCAPGGCRRPSSALVGADPALTDQVVETLVARRLLARDGDHLEVAHEALLAAWPRLAAWLADDAVGRAVRRHLAPAAVEWAAHGRPADELLPRDPAGGRGRVGRPTPTPAPPSWSASSSRPASPRPGGAGGRPGPGRRRGGRTAAYPPARRRPRGGAGRRAGVRRGRPRLPAHGRRSAPPRPGPPRRWPTPTGWRRCPRRRARSTSRCCSPRQPCRPPTHPRPATACSSALVEHRRATGVHQLSAEGIEETALSADGRTMAITIGGGTPRVMTWRPGSSAPPRPIAADWGPERLAVSPDGDTWPASR